MASRVVVVARNAWGDSSRVPDSSARQARMNASWTMSSAWPTLAVIR